MVSSGDQFLIKCLFECGKVWFAQFDQ